MAAANRSFLAWFTIMRIIGKRFINFKFQHMESLREQIKHAKSVEELEFIIESIPRQENGHRQQIARILDDSFWYIDIVTLEQHKEFMLKRI